jgi:hypothetical protein
MSTDILYVLKENEDVALFQLELTCFQDLVMSVNQDSTHQNGTF